MKKLVAIAVSLAAFAIAAWLVRSPPGGDAGTKKSPELAPASSARPGRRESAEPAPAAGRIDEAQQLAQCRALWERERKLEQAARAAEGKDSAWA